MRILHLSGSQTSSYYHGVSMDMYTPGCLQAFPDQSHKILLANLDGSWSVVDDINESTIANARRMKLSDALRTVEQWKPEVMQPHMFCYRGMVSCRGIADLLDIPMVGSPGHVMALTTDKGQSRAVVSAHGVPVPKGSILRRGDSIPMEPPFLLKPCREDNSMGITLVREKSEIEGALETAFSFDDMIVCEQFIPLGRELRVGVVASEDGKSLEFLPAMEYFLDKKDVPIRTSEDKINTSDESGKLVLAPVDRVCPAYVDDELKEKLFDLASKAHVALGCEQYSLYDVRVDPDGNPFFIEASPYCSFASKSPLVLMSCGNPAYDNTTLFYRFLHQAIESYTTIPDMCQQVQTLGMRHQKKELKKSRSESLPH